MLPGGRHIVWTVAGGAKGRRWRSVTSHGDGRMEASLLVETAPDGRLVKLELAPYYKRSTGTVRMRC